MHFLNLNFKSGFNTFFGGGGVVGNMCTDVKRG